MACIAGFSLSLTVLEAIMVAKMSLVNAFTHNRSSNTRCVALLAQVYSVTLLPIEKPLSHENKTIGVY